jgi:hypothetical protein
MLDLDDPRWSALRHAYGDAGDVPGLLRAAAASPGPMEDHEAEPWCSLWSSLCHQGEASTASYAAVPHLVRIASEVTGPIDFSFLALPADVEIARRTGLGPDVPEDLAEAYHVAIASLVDVVALHRNEVWDESMLLSATVALAVAKGHIEVAEALSNLDAYWIAKMRSNGGD